MISVLGAVAFFLFGTANCDPDSHSLENDKVFLYSRHRRNLLPHKFGSDAERVPINETMLPKLLTPVEYFLLLKVYLPDYGAKFDDSKKFTFEGTVMIDVVNDVPLDEIVLNQWNLSVNTVLIISDISIVNAEAKLDHRTQKMTISSPLNPGKHRIIIAYSGFMTDQEAGPDGLFPSKYTTLNNETRFAAITQFEPTAARSMVPCFDEPEYKATWAVTIVHPKETKAVANSIELNAFEGDGWKTTSFEKTPIMSSYLLAIGVFGYEFVEGKTQSGMRVRIYASPRLIKFGANALKHVIQCIDGFEKYFGVPIPLKKFDSVAAEAQKGAMENWGLVYYSPSDLLYGKWSATVIAHELAHQWFGNLVTLKWWDQLYLNEGLATLMELKGLEYIEDGKYIKQIAAVSYQSRAMKIEKAGRSRPLASKILFHDEIWSQFNEIAYEKGGSVMGMIRNVVTEKNFLAALKEYLNDHAYQNVVQDDLFAKLDKYCSSDCFPAGMNVKSFAERWALQMGFPVVGLEEYNSTHCEITQLRSPMPKEDPRYQNNPYGYKWDVPVFIQYKEVETNYPMHWLQHNGTLHVPCDVNQAVVLNPEGSAYFVSNYSPTGWLNIVQQLKENPKFLSNATKKRMFDDVEMLLKDKMITPALRQEVISALQTTEFKNKMSKKSLFS